MLRHVVNALLGETPVGKSAAHLSLHAVDEQPPRQSRYGLHCASLPHAAPSVQHEVSTHAEHAADVLAPC